MERIKLNLIPSGVAPIVHLSQYDDGRQFGIDLFEGESVYVLDGTETLTVNSRKPDGHVVTLTVTNTGTSSLDVDTVEQLTAVHGVSYAKLKIEKGFITIATLPFLIDVSRDPLENGDPSESFIQNLETQVSEMVAEDVAEQYDSSNVIFDEKPTENHGIGYAVTSEGIKTAIDNAFDYDNTASGSLVHITDGADNIPVKSLVSQIVATGGGGTPDAPIAINGFDSVVVTRCGKNLIDDSKYYQLNANIVVVGQTETNANHRVYLPKGTYTIVVTSSVIATIYYDFGSGPVSLGNTTASRTFTLENNSYCAFWLYKSGGYSPTNYTSIQLEYGETATTYEPYTGNTYTFAFGQTVYGGHFDNKGSLVITHIFGELVAKTKNGNYFRATLSDLGLPNIYDRNADLLCDRYAVADVTTTTSNNNQITIYGDVGDAYAIRWVDLDYINSDVATYNTAMENNKPKIVYKLATPITLAITSQDIPTLLGENNIFSNCGDVEVTYYTNKSNDILEFIDSEIGKKNGTNIPIEANSQDSIKDYVDNSLSNINLDDLSDTDISGETSGQILAFDGANWVNANQIVVKYEEKDIAFDSSGEGTLYYANGYILGLKDIPSDSLYIGYITYMAGTKTMVKGFNRSATSFDSTAIANTTRKIGIYYLDNITTQ